MVVRHRVHLALHRRSQFYPVRMVVCARKHSHLPVHHVSMDLALSVVVCALAKTQSHQSSFAADPPRLSGRTWLFAGRPGTLRNSVSRPPVLRQIAGQIANGIVHEGERLAASEVLIFAFVVLALLIVLSPLLPVFTPKLYRLKRAGLVDYGRLANQHMQEFDRKWVRGRPEGESLLGTRILSVPSRPRRGLLRYPRDAHRPSQ